MLLQLVPPVPRQRRHQLARQPAHLADQAIDHRHGGLARHPHQVHVARVALDQGGDHRLPGPHEQIALPVARQRAVGDLRRALADRDGVDDLPAPRCAARGGLGAPVRALRAQVRGELALERAARLHEERAVDRLGGHVERGDVGVGAPQPAGNLGGRPVLSEPVGHEAAQPAHARQRAALGAGALLPRARLRGHGPIARAAAVAGQLPADGRRRAPERPRDHPHPRARLDQAGDRLTLAGRQRPRGALPHAGGAAAGGTDDILHRARMPAERGGNLGQRVPGLEPGPQHRPLCGADSRPSLAHNPRSDECVNLVLHAPVETTAEIRGQLQFAERRAPSAFRRQQRSDLRGADAVAPPEHLERRGGGLAAERAVLGGHAVAVGRDVGLVLHVLRREAERLAEEHQRRDAVAQEGRVEQPVAQLVELLLLREHAGPLGVAEGGGEFGGHRVGSTTMVSAGRRARRESWSLTRRPSAASADAGPSAM